ncbi:hypothetical protein GCM10014713_22200 [Streptomyces purpureus]|uniref:Lipoprotein n=2 Tax=Streptomyces purpureus TaxID=1951 RepID=A0A918GZY9_9ACTN|nr:hypothetical protein GCM10014713_22200 [Streptomyces purpureus]
MIRISRGLAGAAMVVTLAASAACGGGGDGPEPNRTTATPETTDTETDPARGDTLGTIFPGKGGGGQAAPVRVPTAKVNERTGGKLKFRNDTDGDVSMGDPQAKPDEPGKGQTFASRGNCPDPLPAGEECEMTVGHTAYVAGPYSGVVTIETSDGETITVPYSGEAVGDDATDTSSPTPGTTDPTGPTETETPDVETTEPEPYLS